MNKEEAIISVSAYLPNSFIIKIIKLCNLYPVNSWRLWEDSFGNGIKINNKNKKGKTISPIGKIKNGGNKSEDKNPRITNLNKIFKLAGTSISTSSK